MIAGSPDAAYHRLGVHNEARYGMSNNPPRLVLLPLALAAGVLLGIGLSHWLGGRTQTDEERLGPGIGRAEAMRIAKSEGTPVAARAGPLRQFEDAGSSMPGHDDDLVWAVLVAGSFGSLSCGPGPTPDQPPHPCPEPATTGMLVLDYRSGETLFFEIPAPTELLNSP